MASGHVVDNDGKRWTISLRDGLRFHDNEPVLARHCVASVERWMKRDAVTKTLALRIGALEAANDRTIVFRLKKPFPRLPFALGKAQPNTLPAMPARLAAIDASVQIFEMIGSGPLRFEPKEFAAGHLAVQTRFAAYRPREETPNGTAGARVAKLDRIVWRAMSDPATAASALLKGEVDWIETPLPILLGKLRANKDIVVDIADPHGCRGVDRLAGKSVGRGIA